MEKQKTLLDEELEKVILAADNPPIIEMDFEIPTVDELLKPADEIQDPKEAYKLYYKTYQHLLKKYLPKDPSFKKINKLIREQGSLFLKDGNKRGQDSRQAYHHKMRKVANVIITWVNTTKGKDLIGLYNELRDLNK